MDHFDIMNITLECIKLATIVRLLFLLAWFNLTINVDVVGLDTFTVMFVALFIERKKKQL